MLDYIFIMVLIIVGAIACVSLFLEIYFHKHDLDMIREHKTDYENGFGEAEFYRKKIADKQDGLIIAQQKFIHTLFKKGIISEKEWNNFLEIYQDHNITWKG